MEFAKALKQRNKHSVSLQCDSPQRNARNKLSGRQRRKITFPRIRGGDDHSFRIRKGGGSRGLDIAYLKQCDHFQQNARKKNGRKTKGRRRRRSDDRSSHLSLSISLFLPLSLSLSLSLSLYGAALTSVRSSFTTV